MRCSQEHGTRTGADSNFLPSVGRDKPGVTPVRRRPLAPAVGFFLLATLLRSLTWTANAEIHGVPTCGLALRRISPSPGPIESGTLLLFAESAPRTAALKRNRLAWFEPTDELSHDLAFRLSGGNRSSAGYSARGHAVAFLCDREGPFQLECLTHGKILFTGFVLDGDWVTICDDEGCRFAVLPDGEYASTFWTSAGQKRPGPVVHVSHRKISPPAIEGYELKLED
jgi:hypothetical protein